uniref:Uncharacterized protein n=1 Tax=Strigamia maritima TaxID=126957 RepID=T1J5J9_STRMM
MRMLMQQKRVRGINPLFVKSKKRNVKNINNDKQNDFLGLTRLFDHSYSPFYKTVWFSIVALCFSGCTYQIALRVGAYLQGSITLEIHLKQQTFFMFPTITLCNVNILDIVDNILSTKNTQNHPSFTNTEQLWSQYSGIKREDLFIETMCFLEDCSKPITDLMDIDYVNTVYGRCVILRLKNETEYRGPYTYYEIIWNSSNSVEPILGNEYIFFLHDDTFKHRHDGILKAENALYNYNSNFRIYAKELKNLNSKRNPCGTAEEVNVCLNDCIDKQILKQITCRIPITINKTQEDCTNFGSILDNYKKLYHLFFNITRYFEECNCKRKCNETKYTLHKDDERLSDNGNTRLNLLYADDTHETVTEREIFTSSALFSEIGGTIGLYLGISIIALVDFFESIIRGSLKPKASLNQRSLTNKVRNIYY